jgi:hypothetical protein
MDADLVKDRLRESAYLVITCDNYLPLWEGMLQISKMGKLTGMML